MTQTHVLSLLRLAGVAAAFWFTAPGIPAAQAAETTLTWSDDFCENTIHFDPKKHNETEVRNTIHLLFGPADFETPMVIYPFQMGAPRWIDKGLFERARAGQEPKLPVATARD